MKRKESRYAIKCYPYDGPRFGGDLIYNDLFIDGHCNEEDSCSIYNKGTNAYECHPEYKSSLFVNTAGPDERNKFSVLDYEVFGIDYESKYTIDHICKYPDIIWKYMETNDISEESLKQFDDERELLDDLDTIHCKDSDILVKISQCCLKNPSEMLPNTYLVSQQYDSKLREWIGDYKWNLLYRASEHGYSAESFHKCCDNKGPTLVIIKSPKGWIFGGYTTQSWKYNNSNYGIYYDVI